MLHDEIVEEIHKIREECSQSFNHDLKAIFADLQKQQAESGREVVSLSRKHGITTHWSGWAPSFDYETKVDPNSQMTQ